MRTKLAATRSTAALVAGDVSDTERLRRRLRSRSIVLFVVIAAGVVAGVLYVLRSYDFSTLVDAAVVVSGAVIIAGLYALLVDGTHAVRALAAAGGGAGAIAAIDQVLAHFK